MLIGFGHQKKDQKGQALVELALILPVLLLLLLGTIELGRILGTSLLLSHAAREGSRIAAVGGNDAAINQHLHYVSNLVDTNHLTISISPSPTRKRGQNVTVKLTYSLPLYAPLISNIVTNPFPIEVQTTMRVE